MWHTWERSEMYTKFWSENLKERDQSENLAIYGRIILEYSSRKEGGRCGLDSTDSG
jgi:hypothetical protein